MDPSKKLPSSNSPLQSNIPSSASNTNQPSPTPLPLPSPTPTQNHPILPSNLPGRVRNTSKPEPIETNKANPPTLETQNTSEKALIESITQKLIPFFTAFSGLNKPEHKEAIDQLVHVYVTLFLEYYKAKTERLVESLDIFFSHNTYSSQMIPGFLSDICTPFIPHNLFVHLLSPEFEKTLETAQLLISNKILKFDSKKNEWVLDSNVAQKKNISLDNEATNNEARNKALDLLNDIHTYIESTKNPQFTPDESNTNYQELIGLYIDVFEYAKSNNKIEKYRPLYFSINTINEFIRNVKIKKEIKKIESDHKQALDLLIKSTKKEKISDQAKSKKINDYQSNIDTQIKEKTEKLIENTEICQKFRKLHEIITSVWFNLGTNSIEELNPNEIKLHNAIMSLISRDDLDDRAISFALKILSQNIFTDLKAKLIIENRSVSEALLLTEDSINKRLEELKQQKDNILEIQKKIAELVPKIDALNIEISRETAKEESGNKKIEQLNQELNQLDGELFYIRDDYNRVLRSKKSTEIYMSGVKLEKIERDIKYLQGQIPIIAAKKKFLKAVLARSLDQFSKPIKALLEIRKSYIEAYNPANIKIDHQKYGKQTIDFLVSARQVIREISADTIYGEISEIYFDQAKNIEE